MSTGVPTAAPGCATDPMKVSARFFALPVLFIAGMALLGWQIDNDRLKSVLPGLVAMNPATAVAFFLTALAILLPRGAVAANACACAVFLIGTVRILGYLTAFDLGVDQILFGDRLAGNMMAPNTALNFILIGFALMFVNARSGLLNWMSEAAIAASLLISFLALIGYAYGFTALYKVKFYIPMAANTGTAFLCAGVGVLCLRPDRGFIRVLLSRDLGGAMARRIFPATIVVPTLFGGLTLLAQNAGHINSEFGLMLMVVFTALIFTALIRWTATLVSRSDKAARQAEAALQRVNDDLELKVRERTTKLMEAQKLLVQQERLRALGQMAGGIAHDFNNALSPILGFTELILDNPDIFDDRDACAGYLRAMNTAAKDAANVVKRLRDFSRQKESGEKFTAVDLNAVVREALVMTRPKWKNQALASGVDIRVRTEYGAVPAVAGSGTELREALTNLIFNAVDAMPEGGEIVIRTRRENGCAVIEVSDTGYGMPEDVRRRCLEPFFTTKGARGTGLGLSMVYGTLQRHEAKLDIRSAKGEGACFVITFPASTTAPGGDRAPDPAAVKARRIRILYVEDEERVRTVFSLYMKGDGHTVEEAKNSDEALAKFKTGDYDLVITDHAMPGMSGEELARVLKKLSPGKPVILLSGTFDTEGAPGASPGIDAVLKKPVTLDQLRRAIAGLFPAD